MDVVGKLYTVSGAPGAGKSVVVPELVRLAHRQVVMDIDELLENDALLGMPIATPNASAIWPAYGRMWRRIIDMTRRSGHDVIWLSPSVPSEFGGATAWALLDCADDVRLRRLKERDWDVHRIDDAMADAEQYRTEFASSEPPTELIGQAKPVDDRGRRRADVVSCVIRTDDATPAEVARRILRWAS